MCLAGSPFGAAHAASGAAGGGNAQHVLLISVDGLHASDLENYITTHPTSTMATLAARGVRYPNASTAQPSDSFPGSLTEFTGGLPKSVGVYYDDSYDRSLVAPVVLGGSPTGVTCTPGSASNVTGTEVLLDETVDISDALINGGGGINTDALPRDPKTCAPVYPHQYVRVNTVFNVVKDHGGRTAWSDKHVGAYDIVNGHPGGGVDDLYSPEIAATYQPDGHTCLYADCGTGTDNVTDTIQYDNLKVNAIVNEIDGRSSTGANPSAGVPELFGMNFQAVSVGEKSPTGGYAPDPSAVGGFAPTGDLSMALDYVDSALGRMVAVLNQRHLLSSTQIIVTAKHGQAPIDRSTLRKIGHAVAKVLGSAALTPTQVTDDDVALVWYQNPSRSQTDAAVRALIAMSSTVGVSNPDQILCSDQSLCGPRLVQQFGDPAKDPRVPDIIVTPDAGVIYTKAAKIAEHGGFSKDDTNVALLVVNPQSTAAASVQTAAGTVNTEAVQTTQIAPTILAALGLNPNELQAVQQEGTQVLPGLGLGGNGGPGGGTATPELGSGELLATGLVPLAAVLLYRKRRRVLARERHQAQL